MATHHLFIDEAGTSTQEPVTIVAGVLVDQQGRARVESYLEKLREMVPEEVRNGFVFHAKEIVSGGPRVDREHWNRRGVERRAVMDGLLAAPRLCGLQAGFGYDRKRPQGYFAAKEHVFRHGIAFLQCLHVSSEILRSRFQDGVASVVAEDHREMRGKLAGMIDDLGAPVIRAVFNRDAPTNLVRPISFAKKDGDPVLQIADAAAYGMRAALSGSPNAAQYESAIFGKQRDLAGIAAGQSGFFALDFAPGSGN